MIDDEIRAKYDKDGEEGLQNAQTMDSKAMFEMIFGTEKFDPLLGELQTMQMMNMTDDTPPEFLKFK